MKTKFYILALCALSLCFFGCKDKKNEPKSLIGTVATPMWTFPDNYDMTSSMTAVVKVNLYDNHTDEQLSAANYQLSAEDILAAFSDNECLGVATVANDSYRSQIVANDSYRSQTQQEGLFFLYICAPTNGENITLRYYSSALKNIFTAEPFTFVNDAQLGSIAEPYMPQFVIEK